MRDPEHLECRQHHHQTAGQNAQAVDGQTGQLEVFHMFDFQQAQRQAQQATVGDTALAVIIEAIGLEHLGQHPRRP
ncbi:hypothetical protein D9M69_502960 [compost metagenome]